MTYRITSIILLLLASISIEAFNRSLFFRASSFWGEPRFERSWLSTLDIQLAGGGGHSAENHCGERVPLFSLYGPENIETLSRINPNHPLILPRNPKEICFQGVADVFEADFNLYQNFFHGFFTQFHFPVILLQLYPSGFTDTCPKGKEARCYTPAWQGDMNTISQFIAPHNLSLCCERQAAASDATLFIGWTYTYEDTQYLDYIDFTTKTGVLFPTGKKRALDQVFSIPFGYNGHWAIPLSGDISLGLYDWVTFGLHADGLFFFSRRACTRFKLPEESPTGFITLGKGITCTKPGTVFRLGTYLKADHFFSGLSTLLGFTYEKQQKSDTEQFQEWSRSIVHLLVEYDFSHTSELGPQLGFFYDKQMTGKRVFDISMLGGYLGINICWQY